ncbi:MAG: DUF3892 domain-containing protein [Candidatus Binatus sp.]|jgi:transketolase C-terminal domain/subunit
MSDRKVFCVNKPDRNSRHEHITHLGGTDRLTGASWKFTREQVIRRILRQIDTFYTTDDKARKRADVEVVNEVGKALYVRTRQDGVLSDNLLHLPECRATIVR